MSTIFETKIVKHLYQYLETIDAKNQNDRMKENKKIVYEEFVPFLSNLIFNSFTGNFCDVESVATPTFIPAPAFSVLRLIYDKIDFSELPSKIEFDDFASVWTNVKFEPCCTTFNGEEIDSFKITFINSALENKPFCEYIYTPKELENDKVEDIFEKICSNLEKYIEKYFIWVSKSSNAAITSNSKTNVNQLDTNPLYDLVVLTYYIRKCIGRIGASYPQWLYTLLAAKRTTSVSVLTSILKITSVVNPKIVEWYKSPSNNLVRVSTFKRDVKDKEGNVEVKTLSSTKLQLVSLMGEGFLYNLNIFGKHATRVSTIPSVDIGAIDEI